MAENGAGAKPTVLVLGGVGFIGRHFVHHLIKNDLVSKVRVIDKVMPQMAWLNQTHKETFDSPKVDFRHANLINPNSVSSAFSDETFDYVINCAAETKYGQTESVYKDGVYTLSMNCAQEAAKKEVKCFVEISSGQMKSTDKDPITEDVKCDPWTLLARQKFAVEEDLKSVDGLSYIIVRPAMVYGIADKQQITPRLVVGGVYKHLQENMKMLWTENLRMNTVHIEDVSRAIWHLCLNGSRGEVYHLADKGNTTQGRIGALVSEIFSINYDFVGSMVSSLAKMSITDVAEDINDKHMEPWGQVCQQDGIVNTPLNPYIDEELLFDKHLYIDGSKIEQTGFRYEKPVIDVQLLKEVLDDYLQMNLFPPSLLKSS